MFSKTDEKPNLKYLSIKLIVLVSVTIFISTTFIYGFELRVPPSSSEIDTLKQKAINGDVVFQKILGDYYFNGYGVPQDYLEAFKWFKMGAEQGDAFCQNIVGDFYFNGLGVAKDDIEAEKWYRLSARQGYSVAKFNFGQYYNGELKLATEQGLEFAILILAIGPYVAERLKNH